VGGPSNGLSEVNQGQRLGGHGLRFAGNVYRGEARPINPSGLRGARERTAGGLQWQHHFLHRRIVNQAKRKEHGFPVEGGDGVHGHFCAKAEGHVRGRRDDRGGSTKNQFLVRSAFYSNRLRLILGMLCQIQELRVNLLE